MSGVLKSLKIRPQAYSPFTHLYVLRRTLVAKAEMYCGKDPGSVGRPPHPHVLSLYYFLHPCISPILSLTFYYSLSSIRPSLTLHSSLFSYPFLVISYSSPSSPIPVPVRLHNSKEGLREKLTSRAKIRTWNVFSRINKILAEFLNSLVAFCSTTGKPTHLFRTKCASLDSV
jgi:hypothetical protein